MIKTIFSVSRNKIIQLNGRIELLDFLRGGAMLLVLLHHSGVPYGKWILAFHMPLFFILSGYTDAAKTKCAEESFGKFVLKKAKRLLFPYFSFEIINLLLWYILCLFTGQNLQLVSPLVSIALCINTSSYIGLCGRLWFLPCMFISSIIFFLCKRFIKSKEGLFCAAGLCLIVSYITTNVLPFRLPFTIDTAFMATFFLFVGYLGRKSLDYLLDNGHILIDIILCLLMFLILYSTYRTDQAKMWMFINVYGDYIYSVLGAVGGSFAFIIIAKYLYYVINKIPIINSFVLWYSYNSLASFPVHLQIKCILINLGISWVTIWWILFIVMLFGNIIIVNIITNYLPFLLGQRYQKR